LYASTDTQAPYAWIKPIGFDDLPAHSPLHRLHACWTKYARNGRLPARADIDPVELGASVIPWIVLLDVIRSGAELDYRYRLLGTANVNLLGIDRTGEHVSDNLAATDAARVKKSFDAVVLTGKPVFTMAGLPHKREFLVSVYRAFYPLAADGVTVDMVLGAAIPEDVRR
jgi:hypothetical protein